MRVKRWICYSAIFLACRSTYDLRIYFLKQDIIWSFHAEVVISSSLHLCTWNASLEHFQNSQLLNMAYISDDYR